MCLCSEGRLTPRLLSSPWGALGAAPGTQDAFAWSQSRAGFQSRGQGARAAASCTARPGSRCRMTAGSGSAPSLPASERFAIMSTPFSRLASRRPPPLSCGLGLHLVQITCLPTDGGKSASAGRGAQGILPPGGGWGALGSAS